MRRLLAPLSRWLDRRIDARIAYGADRTAAPLNTILNRIHAHRDERTAVSALAARVAAASAQAHQADPSMHGRSFERVVFGDEISTIGLLDPTPPVGTSFFDVVVAENGWILMSGGAPLPDNHLRHGPVMRLNADGARAIAAALMRAADLQAASAPHPGAR